MKRSFVLSAGAALVAVVIAVQLWRTLRVEQARNAALAARIDALEAAPPVGSVAASEPTPGTRHAGTQVAQGGEPAVSEERGPVGAHSGASAVSPQAGPVSKSTSGVAANAPSGSSSEAARPTLQPVFTAQAGEMAMAMMRQMLIQQYPDLEQELGLTRAEADQFMNLLIRQQEQMGNESMAMFMGGGQQGTADMQALQTRMVEMELASAAEQAAMLGSRYPRWEEYQGVAAARTEVSQLRVALTAGGRPLSDAQAAALVTAFATEEARIQREERAWMASPAAIESSNMMAEQVQRAGAAREQMLSVAAGILTPDQQELYRRQVQQQLEMLRATMGMLGGLASPGQGPAPAGPY